MIGIRRGGRREQFLVSAVLLFISVPTLASEFHAFSTYPVDGWAESVTVCDMNGDGRKDVVLATGSENPFDLAPGDYSIHVFLQRSDGGLAAPVQVPYTSLAEEGNEMIGYRTRTAVASADLNLDGFCDVVVGRRKGLSIVMGRADPAFSVRRINNVVGGYSGDAIVFIDMDGDGYLDIVSHNGTSGDRVYGVAVYYNDRHGGAYAQRYLKTSSDGGMRLSTGDLNGDGLGDIAVSWHQGPDDKIEIFHNDGDGWFGLPIYLEKPEGLLDIGTSSIGDFNGDGRDDIVVGGNDVNFSAGAVYLFRQEADGGFRNPVRMQTTQWTDSSNFPDVLMGADVNGDRLDDLLVLRSGGGIGYFENSYSGIRTERAVAGPYATWSHAHAIASGDVNGDGCVDVVTANYNYGLVVWPISGCRNAVRSYGSQPLPSGSFGGRPLAGGDSHRVDMEAGSDAFRASTQGGQGDAIEFVSGGEVSKLKIGFLLLFAFGFVSGFAYLLTLQIRAR